MEDFLHSQICSASQCNEIHVNIMAEKSLQNFITIKHVNWSYKIAMVTLSTKFLDNKQVKNSHMILKGNRIVYSWNYQIISLVTIWLPLLTQGVNLQFQEEQDQNLNWETKGQCWIYHPERNVNSGFNKHKHQQEKAHCGSF